MTCSRPWFAPALGLIAAAFMLCAFVPAHAHAQNAMGREFGLGLVIGDPTGVTGKYFLSPEHALDFAVGFGIFGSDHITLHGDYLFHFDLKTWPAGALDLYLGAGPKIGIVNRRNDDRVLLGARAPFGLAMMFSKVPIDVFVEIAAGLWIIDRVDLYLDAAIGARYWF